jgi:hypothetical protein
MKLVIPFTLNIQKQCNITHLLPSSRKFRSCPALGFFKAHPNLRQSIPKTATNKPTSTPPSPIKDRPAILASTKLVVGLGPVFPGVVAPGVVVVWDVTVKPPLPPPVPLLPGRLVVEAVELPYEVPGDLVVEFEGEVGHGRYSV